MESFRLVFVKCLNRLFTQVWFIHKLNNFSLVNSPISWWMSRFSVNMSLWRMGRGREPWERSEAGGGNDNERHLRHPPVSSPTEELWKDKRRSDDSERRERTRPGVLFCVRQSFGRGCRFSFVFIMLLKFWVIAGSPRLLPDLWTVTESFKLLLGSFYGAFCHFGTWPL